MIIWLGIGEQAKVLVIAIAMVAPIALSTASGVRGVQQDRLNAARPLGATRRQVFRFVVLPSALPSILTGLRIALGAGWTTLVAAELVAATRGLGFMIQSATQFLVTDVVVMGILVIAAVTFMFEFGLRFVERGLCPGPAASNGRPRLRPGTYARMVSRMALRPRSMGSPSVTSTKPAVTTLRSLGCSPIDNASDTS